MSSILKTIKNLKNNNLDFSLKGFTLVEILIVVSVLIIISASGVAIFSSRTTQASLDASSKEVIEIISQARNYAVTGYFGDAWGIRILDNSSACVDSGDCVIMFKGESFVSRDIAYDRSVQLDRGVYIDASETNEFYFKPVAGWLSTTTGALAEQQLILKSNDGESKTISIAASGLAYLFYCGIDEVFDIDGKAYETIQIGDQCWMAENLNTGVMLASAVTDPTNNGVVEKWCYADTANNCDSQGGLYSWDEVMDYSTIQGDKGICPHGWRIPSDDELITLEDNYPSASNATELLLNGSSGMNMLKGGERNNNGSGPGGSYFDGIGTLSTLWTSTCFGDCLSDAYLHYVLDPGTSMLNDTNPKDYGFSVRCLKNY